MKYFFTFIFLFSTFTFGCSCAQSSINESFDKTDAVFIGKVIAVDKTKYDFSSYPVFAYTFEITKDFKRKHPKNKSDKFYTTIYTPQNSIFGGCGSTFSPNETYLIYGYRSEIGTITNICTRTSDLKFVEKIELDSLQLKSDQFFQNKKDILDVDVYGDYSDHNNELLTEYENEILKLKSVHKIYIILICSLALILIISLFFNFRKRK
ncbi:hypothetical protein HXZ62_14025 [Empedobacter falsenii]|uniref:hypothetical protein n=1 Tax=Empedobacter falsenii TaxID=343874 RepID=UPI00257658C1|nr:hypothetical protein [Empedobacter falsenii]MDM1063669.1 hypothetical protein [Empedobacter falsenii]